MEENMNKYKTVAKTVSISIGSVFGYVTIAAGVVMTILILSAVFTNATR
jgi:hypothetical protein